MPNSESRDGRLGEGSKIGGYRIVRVLGEGGMGVVYEGVHESLGKRVAIKTLLASSASNDEVKERFVREGRAIAKIRHPNVVDVFDVTVHEGQPYLIMEYLEGQDLGASMEHEAPMSPQATADLMIPVVSALAAAHDAGIVHRDLKPDNIFVTRTKGGSEPKLVDFGISKLTDKEAMHLTSTHAMLGTPYYMSPEQAGSAKKVDHRSDIFSLGVILYQCVTHELPFKGDSLYQLLGAIMTIEPPSPRSLVGQLPAPFESLIARAMKKDPADRFQSAADLGRALLPFAGPRTRLSYENEFGGTASPFGGTAPPTTLEPARLPLRRSSRWLWASPLLLVAAVGVVGLILRARSQSAATTASAEPAASSVAVAPLPSAAVAPPPPAVASAETAAVAPPLDSASATPEPPPLQGKHEAPRGRRLPARPTPATSSVKIGVVPRPAELVVAPATVEKPAVERAQPVPAARPAPPTDSLFLDRK